MCILVGANEEIWHARKAVGGMNIQNRLSLGTLSYAL